MCAIDLPDPAARDELIARLFDDEQVILLGSGTPTVRFRPTLTVTARGARRRRRRARPLQARSSRPAARPPCEAAAATTLAAPWTDPDVRVDVRQGAASRADHAGPTPDPDPGARSHR
jgi:hypothetical protein